MPEILLRPALDAAAPNRLTNTDDAGVRAPVNSEVRKLAEDTAAALRYAIAAVAANREAAVRPGSLEAILAEDFQAMDEQRRGRYKAKAEIMLGGATAQRKLHFGRYGVMDPDRVAGVGFERLVEAPNLDRLAIDGKLLGAPTATITIPAGANARVADGNLIVPLAALGLTDLEDANALTTSSFEEATIARVQKAAASGIANFERVRTLWGIDEETVAGEGGGDFEEALLDKLRLEISQVYCVDETNPERSWFVNSHDEIALGGTMIDETGDTGKIGETYIGGGFDDGDKRNYSPPWPFAKFDCREGKGWPKKYQVVMFLAEKDHGGFSKFLQSAYSQVQASLKQKIKAYITDALDDTLGPDFAKMLGEAVAWVVDGVIDWMINIFADDIFPPFRATMTHCGYKTRFTVNGKWGSPSSEWKRAYFSGHGGQYRVTYRWTMYA